MPSLARKKSAVAMIIQNKKKWCGVRTFKWPESVSDHSLMKSQIQHFIFLSSTEQFLHQSA